MYEIAAMEVGHAHGNLQGRRHHSLDVRCRPRALALQKSAFHDGVLCSSQGKYQETVLPLSMGTTSGMLQLLHLVQVP